MRMLIFLVAVTFGTLSSAQETRILSFSQWKTQQVTEAENRVARLANRITMLKSDLAQKQPLKPIEHELEGAQQALEIAKQYTIEHYVATYLNQFVDSREALLELSQVTPKEEMADLLAAILKSRPSTFSAIRKAPPVAL